jgi:hypothetical protein
MNRLTILAALLVFAVAQPLTAQHEDTPYPRAPEEIVGTQDLPPKVCPSDYTDGPLYADGTSYHGIPARQIVEGFLAPPHEADDPWRLVSASAVRLLTDGTDYDACLRLTTFITGGARSAPAPRPWVYFTAGGFYFVSQWKPAQALSNYTTGYGHVMVFDSAFTLLGAYAF